MAERPIQLDATLFSKNKCASFGDSLDKNYHTGIKLSEHHSYVIQKYMQKIGCAVEFRNWGVGGMTSSNALIKQVLSGQGTQFGTPKLTTIYIGQNDFGFRTTVAAAPAPTSTTFTLNQVSGSSVGSYYSPGGWLKVNGVSGKIISVVGDLVTHDGVIGTAVAAQAVTNDTAKNIYEMAMYLYKQNDTTGDATFPLERCDKFVIIGANLVNLRSTDGAYRDTPGAQSPRTIYMLAEQTAAVTAINATIGAGKAILSDSYGKMQTYLIANPALWNTGFGHDPNRDIHLNKDGQFFIAMGAFDAIKTAGWHLLL